MAFTWFDTRLSTNVVFFIVDLSDSVRVGSTPNATLAMQWVNRGWNGSGAKTLGLRFPLVTAFGSFTITA